MFGYEFVNLSPEQVEIRRKLLDRAGSQGYLLPILLLSIVYAIRTLSKNVADQSRDYANMKPNIIQRFFHRLNWTLDTTYVPEFGPLQFQLLGSGYASALFYIAMKGTGNDYMHVTKAFGHVAVSQLPIQYLLSIKHPQSPITLATGLTHERLNAYHRLLGRVIHLMLAMHAILYMRFFIAINVLEKRIADSDVRLGLMAFWTVNIIGVLTIPSIRKRAYHKIFYRSHVLLSVLLVIIIWSHVPYTRNYVGQAAFFWVSNGVLRKGKMAEKGDLQCKKVSHNLIAVTATLKSGLSWESWVPGMHGYLNDNGLGPRTPFTAVDVREKNGQAEVKFVIRDLGGPMTKQLGRAAGQEKPLNLEVEGPYGEAREYLFGILKRKTESTLVVAGGVGATYALPIYLALADQKKNSTTTKLIWIVKNLDDAKWGLDMLRGKSNRNVQLFVTQNDDKTKGGSSIALAGTKIVMGKSRPNFGEIVESFFGLPEDGYEPISVMVCGPDGLAQDLRGEMTRYAWTGRKVEWYEEQFGFGGS